MSKRIHLGLDAVGIKHSGGAMVLLDVLEEAAAHPGIGRITVFSSPARMCNFTLPAVAKVRSIEVSVVETIKPLRLAWAAGTGLAARLNGCQLLLGLANIGLGFPGVPVVPFIQQALPFSGEALALLTAKGRLRMGAIRVAIGVSSRAAHTTFVQTPTMRRWVSEAFGIDAERIEVCTPCPRILPSPGDVPTLMHAVDASRRLLFVGNTSPYKNLDVCFEALPMLRREAPNMTIFLTWPSDSRALEGREGVVALGYLDSQALSNAYQAATALVMPSVVETVGLPLTEAMSCGTPVIAADRPYAHDICEDAALFFDPHSPLALRRQVARLLTEPRLREQLISRGLSLVARRRAARPYVTMLDRLCEIVASHSLRPSLG